MAKEPVNVDIRNKEVQCKDCHRKYVCTPRDDYYGYTNTTDGVCEACLLKNVGVKGPAIPFGFPPE